MVEGFTEDTDLVVTGNEGDHDDDNGGDSGTSSGGDTNPNKGRLATTTDRSQYKIERPADDPFGQPQSIKFDDGNQVGFSYDQNGNLIGVSDTASGVTMQHTDNGWLITNKDGSYSYANGDLSVDLQTGALVMKADTGYTITTMPDGRTNVTDANGNLVAVANPNYRVGDNDQYKTSPTGGEGVYDDQGQLIRATDTRGNMYVKTGDGQWATIGSDGQFKAVDGEVKIDGYRGVYVVPASQGTRNIDK